MGYQTEFARCPASSIPSPASNVLAEKNLVLLEGLDYATAEELVERSREPHVVEYCGNDADSRFSNVAAVETWLKKVA